VLSVAEEFPHCVPVFPGCFDAGYVAAAGKHDQLGSGDSAGDRLGLGGAANEVKLAGHDERGTCDTAEQGAYQKRNCGACSRQREASHKGSHPTSALLLRH
jgi:hypothetical protein